MKIKIYYDTDELYPYHSFRESESFSYDDEFIEIDRKEWKDFITKSNKFWEAYSKLKEKIELKDKEKNGK